MSVQCLATNGTSITTYPCAKGSGIMTEKKGGKILRVEGTNIVSSGHDRATDMIMKSQNL